MKNTPMTGREILSEVNVFNGIVKYEAKISNARSLGYKERRRIDEGIKPQRIAEMLALHNMYTEIQEQIDDTLSGRIKNDAENFSTLTQKIDALADTIAETPPDVLNTYINGYRPSIGMGIESLVKTARDVRELAEKHTGTTLSAIVQKDPDNKEANKLYAESRNCTTLLEFYRLSAQPTAYELTLNNLCAKYGLIESSDFTKGASYEKCEHVSKEIDNCENMFVEYLKNRQVDTFYQLYSNLFELPLGASRIQTSTESFNGLLKTLDDIRTSPEFGDELAKSCRKFYENGNTMDASMAAKSCLLEIAGFHVNDTVKRYVEKCFAQDTLTYIRGQLNSNEAIVETIAQSPINVEHEQQQIETIAEAQVSEPAIITEQEQNTAQEPVLNPTQEPSEEPVFTEEQNTEPEQDAEPEPTKVVEQPIKPFVSTFEDSYTQLPSIWGDEEVKNAPTQERKVEETQLEEESTEVVEKKHKAGRRKNVSNQQARAERHEKAAQKMALKEAEKKQKELEKKQRKLEKEAEKKQEKAKDKINYYFTSLVGEMEREFFEQAQREKEEYDEKVRQGLINPVENTSTQEASETKVTKRKRRTRAEIDAAKAEKLKEQQEIYDQLVNLQGNHDKNIAEIKAERQLEKDLPQLEEAYARELAPFAEAVTPDDPFYTTQEPQEIEQEAPQEVQPQETQPVLEQEPQQVEPISREEQETVQPYNEETGNTPIEQAVLKALAQLGDKVDFNSIESMGCTLEFKDGIVTFKDVKLSLK